MTLKKIQICPMGKLKLVIVCLMLFGSSYSLASVSDSSQIKKTERFELGVRGFNVHNDFVNHSNAGWCIYGNFNFPLFKKIGVKGLVQAGYDQIVTSEFIQKSEWFGKPFWVGAGLQKSFGIVASDDLTIGIGFKAFGFSKPDSWLYNPETGERQYSMFTSIRLGRFME
jgi:hypothetical protein